VSASRIPPTPRAPGVSEVRYSILNLLEEIKADRNATSFAMERLDQHEIGKIFKAKTPRAKRKK
jgi:hypothetical protein